MPQTMAATKPTTSSTKPNMTAKAVADAKQSAASKMHRRSRTGEYSSLLSYDRGHRPGARLTPLKAALLAGFEGRSAMRAKTAAEPATISASSVNTSGPCGGAITSNAASKRSTSRTLSSIPSYKRRMPTACHYRQVLHLVCTIRLPKAWLEHEEGQWTRPSPESTSIKFLRQISSLLQ